MAKQSPILYSVSKTFMWFAIVSLVLLGSLLGIVLLDHHREWKEYQKKFISLKVQKAKEELKQAEGKIDKNKLAELDKQYIEAHKALKTHQKDYQKAQNELEAANTQAVKAKAQYQDLKQYQDSYRYFFEDYQAHKDPKAADYEKKLKEITPRVDQAKTRSEDIDKRMAEKQSKVDEFVAKEKLLKREIDKVLEEKNLIKNKIGRIQPSIAKDILNAPMLDFMAPSLRIQQVVLEDLYDDYHFAKVQKVDRCTTCHLAIDQKGFEDAPQPFKTHPKLDLYLAASSSHPVEKFGCTTCHGGNGHSVSFKDSAHTPKSEEQKKEWEKKHHWEALEKWDDKMLPTNHLEAACAKCHTNVVEVPQATKLNRGRALAEKYGCFNCHKVDGFSAGDKTSSGGENRWRVGPDLENVKSKLDEDWIIRWLQNPKIFRQSTTMPQVFHLSNTSSPEDRDRSNAAIHAISAYLIKNSESVGLQSPPVSGNKERGEQLVKELGCLGCHTAAGIKANDFGPELSNLGSKVKPEWLYTWLKDPKHYSKNTRMPNLRLSDEDASDITSYLLAQKNTPFDGQAIPQVKQQTIDAMILENLQSTMHRSEAEKELGGMSSEDKLQFLGKKSIAHQGCYSCHSIKGFEDAKPIGAELTKEGSKDLHQFDFGFIHLDHTRHAWIAQKLKEPRIFDKGKVKSYYEKLRMPQFNFTDGEIDDLTTFILSLTDQSVPLQMKRQLDLKDIQTERGRLIVSKFNCNGCHTLDGKTGGLWEAAEDKGSAPPVLDGEGAKVQEKWLHSFMNSPTPIRPWLKYRMPTFSFKEDELRTLVQYFSNLSNEEISYKGLEIPETTQAKLDAGHAIFDQFQCAKCHQVNADSAAMGTSFLAPDLKMSKERLKPEWVKEWIANPEAIQEGTMMPGFFPDGQSPLPDVLGGDANAQIEAIRDYLYTYQDDTQTKSKS